MDQLLDWMASETGIRMVGFIGLGFILYSVFLLIGSVKSKELRSGYVNPVLALELPKDKEEIEAIKKADGGKVAAFVRKNVHQDFGYIPLYVLFFACSSLLVARYSHTSLAWLGWAATVSIVIAGLLDLVENRGMLKTLNTTSGASDSLAAWIRYPSLGKWALLFVCCLCLGVMLWDQRGWLRVPGIIFSLSAFSGLAGVVLNLLKPRVYPMFPWAIGLIALGTILTTTIFLCCPHFLSNSDRL